MRHIFGAIVIMLVSCGVGAAANAAKFKIPWMSQAVPPVAVSAPESASSQPSAVPTTQQTVSEKASTAPKAGVVDIDTVLKYLKEGGAIFVDAREDHDYVASHFRGALHLPSSAIYANADRIQAVAGIGEKIIVYCGGGDCEASHNVADALRRDFGYIDVVIYEKGWAEVESAQQGPRFEGLVVKGEGN